jgi:sec-independent protein translocase protein TatA
LFTNVLQPTHLLIILIVALLLLGPKRLPDAGRALGKGLKEFRSSLSGDDTDDQIAPAPRPAQQEGSPRELPDSPIVTTPTAELTAASSTPSAANQHASDFHH